MKLRPSLKVRKRYVVVQVLLENGSVGSFSYEEVSKEVMNSFSRFVGTLGLAKASPMVLHKTFDKSKQSLIVKVNHTSVDEFKASLLFVDRIGSKAVIARSVKVSGTLKKAKEETF